MSLTDSAYKNRVKGKKMESKTLGYGLMSKTPNKDACREFAEEFHQSVLLSTQRKALHRGTYSLSLRCISFSWYYREIYFISMCVWSSQKWKWEVWNVYLEEVMPAMGNSQFHAGQDLALSSSPTRIISPVRSMRKF